MKVAIFSTLAIGLAAGLLGALCGVGGGVIMVPAFVTLLGMEHKQAVATSLGVVMLTAIGATANHWQHQSGLVDWRVVALAGAAALVAAWLGSDWMRGLSNQTLTRIFGLLLMVVGVRMVFQGAA